jgi:hypothetical protein
MDNYRCMATKSKFDIIRYNIHGTRPQLNIVTYITSITGIILLLTILLTDGLEISSVDVVA